MNPTFRLDFSVTVMKCHKTGNTEKNLSSLSCLWRNWRRKPTSMGRNLFFFSLYFAPLTSCSSGYLSCLYMWKTEQQTAASISFRPSAELDFSLFPQPLTDCTLFTEKRGQSRVQFELWLHVQICLCQFTNKFTLVVVFPLTKTITHMSGVLTYVKVTVSHSCINIFLPLYGEAVWTPMLCCLRSVCAVVPGVCLLLHQGLEEMMYWLHEKNYYWYS